MGAAPMNREVSISLIALGAIFAGPMITLAGPPFLTDDPEPVEPSHWEAYVFSTYDRGPDGTAIQGPALEFNVGAAPELQLHLVVPWAVSRPHSGPARSGWGDVEVGLKFRFLQETDSRPQIGIFPMVEFPTGDASRGLGNGRAWFKIPLWIQKSWGPWTTYGGGGWAINRAPGMRDHAFGGWFLQRDLCEKLTLGGEIFAQGADAVEGRGAVMANVGGLLHLTPGFSILFSGGRTIRGEMHTIAYVGLYWTWGRRAGSPKDASPVSLRHAMNGAF
jgi:hypothetical protein